MITYQEENLLSIKNEFIPLTIEHWEEVSTFNKNKIKLNLDWKRYKLLSDRNMLYTVTVRKKNKLIGYCIFIIASLTHYSDIIAAETDAVFISQKYRKGFTGYRLLKFAISSLRPKVQLIIMGTKIKPNFSSLLIRLGFELTEYKFTMET